MSEVMLNLENTSPIEYELPRTFDFIESLVALMDSPQPLKKEQEMRVMGKDNLHWHTRG